MPTKEYWQIRFTDRQTGERKTYLRVGFETKEQAINELRIIKKEQEKLKGMGYYLNRPSDFNMFRASMLGKNFRIKKTNITII